MNGPAETATRRSAGPNTPIGAVIPARPRSTAHDPNTHRTQASPTGRGVQITTTPTHGTKHRQKTIPPLAFLPRGSA